MVVTAIEIWQPRWKDRTVLIACHKIRDGKNYIRFTKAKSLPGLYSADGDTIRNSQRCSNGRIECYAVPLSELKTEADDGTAVATAAPQGGVGSDVFLDSYDDLYDE